MHATPAASVIGISSAHSISLLLAFAQTLLQGSHGFITTHRWGRAVRTFINLEGAGGTGRELVFQTGPRNEWLVQALGQAAPYPFANILAQEVFQTGESAIARLLQIHIPVVISISPHKSPSPN
mgnify:CR=1 FL=1